MRRGCALASAAVALGLLAPAEAGTIRYTFSGNITDATEHGASLPAGFSVTDPVSYVFDVDFAAPGHELNLGVPTTLSDYDDGTLSVHYFYASLVSSNPLLPSLGGTPFMNFNTGGNQHCPTCIDPSQVAQGALFGSAFYTNSYANYVLVYVFSSVDTTSTDVQNWLVGQSFSGQNFVSDGTNHYQVNSDLTLDSITAVPEPATMTLLGAGLIGLIARRRQH